MIRLMVKHGHANWALMDQALVSGANFLVGVMLVRYLGVAQYGVYVLLWMVVQFGMSIQNALVVAPMQSIAPKIDEIARSRYLAEVLVLQVALIGLELLAAALSFLVPSKYFPEWWTLQSQCLLFACAIGFQFQDFFRRYLFVCHSPGKAFLLDAIAYMAQLILLFFTMPSQPGFEDAMWRIAAAYGLSAAIGAGLFKFCRLDLLLLIKTTVRHWGSSRWLLGAAVLQWLSGNYFLVCAGVIVGPATVGAIRAAQNVLGVTHIAFQGLENIVPARASTKLNREGAAALSAYVHKVNWALLIFTGGVAGLMALWAGPLFRWIYGSLDENTRIAMYWYMPIYMLVAACLPFRSGLRSLEKTKAVFVAYMLGAGFALLLANSMVRLWAVHGVMCGMLLVQAMTFTTLWAAFRVGVRQYE